MNIDFENIQKIKIVNNVYGGVVAEITKETLEVAVGHSVIIEEKDGG